MPELSMLVVPLRWDFEGLLLDDPPDNRPAPPGEAQARRIVQSQGCTDTGSGIDATRRTRPCSQ